MQFTVDDKQLVRIEAQLDADGDVEINANDVPVLWIRRSGNITLHVGMPDVLGGFGFKIENNHVRILNN